MYTVDFCNKCGKCTKFADHCKACHEVSEDCEFYLE